MYQDTQSCVSCQERQTGGTQVCYLQELLTDFNPLYLYKQLLIKLIDARSKVKYILIAR